MPLQHELFEQRLDIQPPTDASGPRLWIRRVVIWREPGGEAIKKKMLPDLRKRYCRQGTSIRVICLQVFLGRHFPPNSTVSWHPL